MNYNIAICDDDPAACQAVASLVRSWAAARQLLPQINLFPSAEAFLFDYAQHKDYHILLLDIEMKGLNGIQLARQIRRENEAVQILFLTGYPDFMAEGYEVAALHYLLKPIDPNRLEAALDRACKNLRRQEPSVLFSVQGEILRVPAREILYVEAFAHTVTVHTAADSFSVKLSISEVEKRLGEGFVRCHRSYLAGLAHIARITRTDVILTTGAAIPLSRNAYQDVNQAFLRHFRPQGDFQ